METPSGHERAQCHTAPEYQDWDGDPDQSDFQTPAAPSSLFVVLC